METAWQKTESKTQIRQANTPRDDILRNALTEKDRYVQQYKYS